MQVSGHLCLLWKALMSDHAISTKHRNQKAKKAAPNVPSPDSQTLQFFFALLSILVAFPVIYGCLGDSNRTPSASQGPPVLCLQQISLQKTQNQPLCCFL